MGIIDWGWKKGTDGLFWAIEKGSRPKKRVSCKNDSCSRSSFTAKVTRRAARKGILEATCPGCGGIVEITIELKD